MIACAIVPLERADIASMAALHFANFANGWSVSAFEALLGGTGVLALGQRDGAGVLEGFVLLRCVADEAEILTLIVASSARRRGLGANLLSAACDAAGAAGATILHLEVGQANRAALRMYESAGFQRTGVRPDYYPEGDAVIMQLPL